MSDGGGQAVHVNCPFSRHEWEARLREIESAATKGLEAHKEVLDEILLRVKQTNGRVSKLEVDQAVLVARADERAIATKEAARLAAQAASRKAAVIATVISLGGVIVSVVGLWMGK